jgi:hypothetical protein
LAREEEKERQRALREAASRDMAERPLRMGIAYVLQGNYQRAINILKGYASSNPQSADAWYWLARAHHALGQYDKAQAAVSIALEIEPDFAFLSETPSGLEPIPPGRLSEPRPSLSVLPVVQPLPADIALTPVARSLPFLVHSGDKAVSSDAAAARARRGGMVLTRDGGAARLVSSDVYPGERATSRLEYKPYPPLPPGYGAAWIFTDKNFNEIARWRARVDRMGIMSSPRVPVAWKGARTRDVFIWTGREWARLRAKSKTAPESVLYDAREDIASIVRSEGVEWNENDTPALAASASLMRYKWAGELSFAKQELRERERLAREARRATVSRDITSRDVTSDERTVKM